MRHFRLVGQAFVAVTITPCVTRVAEEIVRSSLLRICLFQVISFFFLSFFFLVNWYWYYSFHHEDREMKNSIWKSICNSCIIVDQGWWRIIGKMYLFLSPPFSKHKLRCCMLYEWRRLYGYFSLRIDLWDVVDCKQVANRGKTTWVRSRQRDYRK